MDDARRDELWNEVWELLESGDSESAVRRALSALNEEGDEPELRYLLGIALLDVGETAAAIPELTKAAADSPEWSDARSALAWARFRACRFDEARLEAERALDLDPDNPDAHQLLGHLAERAGDEALAERSFAQARRLDPDRYPEPVEMDEEEVLEIARAAVAELDERVLEILQDTAFFVQDVPAEELLRDADPPLDPQILGLFVGRSLLEQSVQDSGALPNTMYLFRRNLERIASSREELAEEVRITVLHEIAHHFGWDEEELEARGFA